jgi:hypothetical protein
VNGVLQVRTSDYTATNGTSVVLASSTIAGDSVMVVAYGAFNVANTYTQAQADARYPLNSIDLSAGKNKIINGDFGIWQRGTSFTNPVSDTGFTADRFYPVWNGTGATRTLSRQTFTPGTAPVAGYESQYFLRYDVSVAGSSNTYNYIATSIEDARTFAGQTVTLSFWAKASSASSIQTVQIDQFFGSGGSAVNYNALSAGGTFSLTTSWQRFTLTATMASVAGKTIGTGSYLRVFLALPAFSATFSIDVWGMQLEAGSVATAFQTATGNLQAELAACQRYYELGRAVWTGAVVNGNTWGVSNGFKVQKRSAPTVIATTVADNNFNGASATASDQTVYSAMIKVNADGTGDAFYIVDWSAAAEL